MNVIIVGYGRMGREIETILTSRGHSVLYRYDVVDGVGDTNDLSVELLSQADIAIEFSLPAGAVDNGKLYAEAGIKAVVGTTGLNEELSTIRSIVSSSKAGYMYGSNFSIGAHLLFALGEYATKLVNPVPQYDIMTMEIHHNKKKDSPSGTALTLADRIIAASNRKDTIQPEKLDREILPNELHTASLRGGHVPGTHSVLLDSLADTIEIKHTARNRSGFALGAVLAAEWMIDKTGFFSVDDFISEIFSRG